MPKIVRIEKRYKIAATLTEPPISRLCWTGIVLVDRPNAIAISANYSRGLIRRAVVYDYNFKRSIGLIQNAFQCLRQVAHTVEYRDNTTDEGLYHDDFSWLHLAESAERGLAIVIGGKPNLISRHNRFSLER